MSPAIKQVNTKLFRFFLFRHFITTYSTKLQMKHSTFKSYIILNISLSITKRACRLQGRKSFDKFKPFFGVSPLVCEKLWQKINSCATSKSSPKRVLWALLKLNIYVIDLVCVIIVWCALQTFYKCSWVFSTSSTSIKNVRFRELFPSLRCVLFKLMYLLIETPWERRKIITPMLKCYASVDIKYCSFG